jgi:hypothetical protein
MCPAAEDAYLLVAMRDCPAAGIPGPDMSGAPTEAAGAVTEEKRS